MITLRRAQQRYDDRRGRQEEWLTFYAQAADDPLADGFGRLELLSEVRLPPGGETSGHPQSDTETVTYVLEGAVAYDDSLGRSGLLEAGEFRCMTAPRSVRSTETNPSRKDWTHLFRIGLRSSGALAPTDEQKRFSMAERRNDLCLVAAADVRRGSLRLREDALVYSALLGAGQHSVHDLRPGRKAWLHVISGEVALGDVLLTSGDGAGVSAERAISFTASEQSEVLLVDVAEHP